MSNSEDLTLAPVDRQPPHVTIPDPVEKTIGWAIVGLGQLTIEEILPAFAECKISRPVALVTGHPDKGKKLAAVYGIDPKSVYEYRHYDQLAHNPAVDVIYIVLPNTMHAEYTVRGFKAGKHVLCEKPMATSVDEGASMIAAAKGSNRALMIAYRLRYEPFNMTAIEICHRGELGKIKAISAFNGQEVKAPNIRLSQTLGGGPVQDVGVYCINAFRYLTAEEPIEVSAIAHQPKDDPRFREVPESVDFMLRFPSGILATGGCSFGAAECRSLEVRGDNGMLKMDAAFGYRGQRLSVRTKYETSEVNLTPVNHFAAEMDHFSTCILSGETTRTPGEEGLADLRVISAIADSLENSRRIVIKA